MLTRSISGEWETIQSATAAISSDTDRPRHFLRTVANVSPCQFTIYTTSTMYGHDFDRSLFDHMSLDYEYLQQGGHAGCLTHQQVWFPVDFHETFLRKLSRICSFFRNYNDLPGRIANPWYHTDLFTRSTAQLTDIYWGLLTTISINLGIQWDVFYWYTVKYKNFASHNNKHTNSARKFPGDFANFQ